MDACIGACPAPGLRRHGLLNDASVDAIAHANPQHMAHNLTLHLTRSLMAVGFGDAGAEIIADNMRSGGDLNPMVPGQKVTAIFGFCDVRQFTDTTEILQVRPPPLLGQAVPELNELHPVAYT